ncbi:MAG: histidine phosphatase family protein, partial [Pseudomonadota bacterium]
PKGIVEKDMTPALSAAKEAWEEAGVTGKLNVQCLGKFQIRKWGDVCDVEVFRLDVTKIADQWPESDKRSRKWFQLSDAINEVHPAGAGQILQKIALPPFSLTLVRHAKSSHDLMSLNDFTRPLNDRGLRDAPEMGRRLREVGMQPDLIVSSPAGRAIKTAAIIAGEISYPEGAILNAAEIYEAAAGELLELVQSLPDEKRDVMLVGHNPGFTDFANLFLQDGIENIPTCGVVRIAFAAQRWRDISPRCASLLLFDYPKKYEGTL